MLLNKNKLAKMTPADFEAIPNTRKDETGIDGINTSSIYSILIKEAAKNCDYYASDILFDIDFINAILKNKELLHNYQIIIAFREMGVDNFRAIYNQLNDSPSTDNWFLLEYKYRAIYRITITKEEYPIFKEGISETVIMEKVKLPSAYKYL